MESSPEDPSKERTDSEILDPTPPAQDSLPQDSLLAAAKAATTSVAAAVSAAVTGITAAVDAAAHAAPALAAAATSSVRAKPPQRAGSTSHTLSSSSSTSAAGQVVSRKGRQADPNTTDTHADPASLLMPPPLSKSASFSSSKGPRPSMSSSRRESATSEVREDAALFKAANPGSSSPRDFALEHQPGTAAATDTDDFETPRLQPGSSPADQASQFLPEPALRIAARSSFSEVEGSKRFSVSSMQSLASARGVPSSAASANGSDNNSSTGHRNVSGLMASSGGAKGPATSQPESAVSSMTVTTASQAGVGHLAPRDSSHMPQLNDIVKKPSTQPAQPGQQAPVTGPQTGPTPRPIPTRSRSRAKRRPSGSTAASSHHSPSSDRAMVHRERPEKEEVKPAPWGIIGVCALDVKARSKPSRNILNRLIQNREFDVCVFGDKVILDEGMLCPPPCLSACL